MANESMDALFGVMSNEKLLALRDEYADQPSVVVLFDNEINKRDSKETQEGIELEFKVDVNEFLATLPHPESINNFAIFWAEVDVADTEAEKVEVEVVESLAVFDKDGAIITPATMVKELRFPTHKERQWVVKLNHFTRDKESGNDKPKATKLAVQCWRREGTNLIDLGRHKNRTKACEHLGYEAEIGGGSASIPLASHGIIVEPYEGTDFTS